MVWEIGCWIEKKYLLYQEAGYPLGLLVQLGARQGLDKENVFSLKNEFQQIKTNWKLLCF